MSERILAGMARFSGRPGRMSRFVQSSRRYDTFKGDSFTMGAF